MASGESEWPSEPPTAPALSLLHSSRIADLTTQRVDASLSFGCQAHEAPVFVKPGIDTYNGMRYIARDIFENARQELR
jgi:hypothetical protein